MIDNYQKFRITEVSMPFGIPEPILCQG